MIEPLYSFFLIISLLELLGLYHSYPILRNSFYLPIDQVHKKLMIIRKNKPFYAYEIGWLDMSEL